MAKAMTMATRGALGPGAPRAIREAAGYSQMHVAARSGRSLPTVRLYEANPASVCEASRRDLAPIYEEIARSVAAQSAEAG